MGWRLVRITAAAQSPEKRRLKDSAIIAPKSSGKMPSELSRICLRRRAFGKREVLAEETRYGQVFNYWALAIYSDQSLDSEMKASNIIAPV